MIKQMIREKEQVMTDLVCDVDGTWVRYFRIEDRFAYKMQLFNDVPAETALRVVEQMTAAMEHQSYDHGAEWRRTTIEAIPKTEPYSIYQEYVVNFRMKDIY